MPDTIRYHVLCSFSEEKNKKNISVTCLIKTITSRLQRKQNPSFFQQYATSNVYFILNETTTRDRLQPFNCHTCLCIITYSSMLHVSVLFLNLIWCPASIDMDEISLKTKRIYDPKTGRSYVVLDVPQPLVEPQIESSRYFFFHYSYAY